MDKRKNKTTGDIGEEIAEKYLIDLRYKILGKNIELICGEIDILAKDKRTIVIVEVKTVRGAGFGPAKDLVRYKKQQKLRNLARAVMQKFPDSPIRVDVIGVDLSYDPPKIEHIKNAVES